MLPLFIGRIKMSLKFKEFKFVYISLDYLKVLHDIDPEIFYINNPLYEKKPHLGILVNKDNRKYVIPLTSAKEKHKTWDDVTATNYLIYEIINLETDVIDDEDIIVDIKNKELLRQKNIPIEEYEKYKKRILSVLEIKKMFPIKDGVYTYVDINQKDGLEDDEFKRRGLMNKEYRFCLKIRNELEMMLKRKQIKYMINK